HITVTPSKLLFDSVPVGVQVCKTIRIYNPGTDSLMILSNYTISNDGDYAYTGITGKDSIIPPDKYRDVTVCFTPVQKGIRQAVLRLTTNIPKTFEATPRDTAGNILIAIEGTGVPQALLTHSLGDKGFSDSVIVGTKICKSITISNEGDADVILTGWTINNAAFSATGITFPYLLKAKSTQTIDLCATALTVGATNGSLKLTGTVSEKQITLNIPLSIYGLNVCANATPDKLFEGHLVLENTDSAICVDVTNCGDVPTSYTASLPSGTDYTINGTNPSGVIAPGAKATFCIHFNPKTMGDAKTTLTIAPSTPELQPLQIPVGGIGACANVTAPAMTATTIGKGGHQPFSIVITNSGNFDWTPGTPAITPNDGIFTLDNNTIPAVTANGTQTITGTFNPDDINKTYSATLTFTGSAPACASAVSVPLTGHSDAAGVATKTEEAGFSLGQNYPNPFGSVTTFSFTTPTEAAITLSISDLTGRQIKTITNGNVSAGEHTIQFDASQLSSGSYIVTLESNTVRLARQIVVTR
ncbi:MAG TPA: T9SS type A sorting domain-containing protein, partial [Candidatus Kapabacteria bacterium]|nr:T9SS type A sorting domain-containing protein [Candidatus Kapabacteria bacterium]